jgi:hypothetical protein
MGRVTRSRTEALLSAPASDGVATLERWSDSLSARLHYTEGARLVDAWFVPADRRFVALMDAPEERSFDWVIDETAQVLGVSPEAVELRMLVSLRDRWAFRGDPAAPDPTRRNPRAVRWDRIDVAADGQTLRVEFMHGVVDGLHHVELYEDDEEVLVTVFLGINHDFRGGWVADMGVIAWTSIRTAEPIGLKYVNDGAERLRTVSGLRGRRGDGLREPSEISLPSGTDTR